MSLDDISVEVRIYLSKTPLLIHSQSSFWFSKQIIYPSLKFAVRVSGFNQRQRSMTCYILRQKIKTHPFISGGFSMQWSSRRGPDNLLYCSTGVLHMYGTIWTSIDSLALQARLVLLKWLEYLRLDVKSRMDRRPLTLIIYLLCFYLIFLGLDDTLTKWKKQNQHQRSTRNQRISKVSS